MLRPARDMSGWIQFSIKISWRVQAAKIWKKKTLEDAGIILPNTLDFCLKMQKN